MTKETKTEKVVREISDMFEFFKKIPKVKESNKKYPSKNNSNKEKKN